MCMARVSIACRLILVLAYAAATNADEVLACRDAAGLLWFTDQPCVNAVPVPISATSVIERHAPTAAERRTLAELARKPAKPTAKTPSTIRDRDRACEVARDGLEALRHQRRRGYALSESAKLDARERLLRADYDRHC